MNWYRDNAFQNKFDFSTETITADTTLYARFLTSNTPTDISLSVNSIDENKVIGSVIGNLTTTDTTAGDSFNYDLVAGNGDDNNSDFSIDGNQLKSAKSFDFETKNSYKIRIKTTDATGLTFEKKFTIIIKDIGGWFRVNTVAGTYIDDGNTFKENKDGRFIETDSTTFNLGTTEATKYIFILAESVGKLIANPVKGRDFIVNGLPNNLDPKIQMLDNDRLVFYLWLNGAAVNHANSDDTSFTITFNKSIFENPPASNDDIIERVILLNIDFVD